MRNKKHGCATTYGANVVAVDISKAVGTLRTIPRDFYDSITTMFNK